MDAHQTYKSEVVVERTESDSCNAIVIFLAGVVKCISPAAVNAGVAEPNSSRDSPAGMACLQLQGPCAPGKLGRSPPACCSAARYSDNQQLQASKLLATAITRSVPLNAFDLGLCLPLSAGR